MALGHHLERVVAFNNANIVKEYRPRWKASITRRSIVSNRVCEKWYSIETRIPIAYDIS